MAKMIKITGMKTVLRNAAKANSLIGAALARGLKRGGLFLQRESQRIVPVDTSNLKNSAFTRNIGGESFSGGNRPDIIVGYTAEYAAYVHEDLDAAHKRGKVAKFLERPARQKRKEILSIVVEEAKKV